MFNVGERWVFLTVAFYHEGTIAAIYETPWNMFVELAPGGRRVEQSGNFSDAVRSGKFTESEVLPMKQIVSMGALTAAFPFEGVTPKARA
jgi:hypothetical protein